MPNLTAMMDPKRLLEKIPRFDKDRPFRYLGRRVVQAMAEAATANMLLGQRSAPGRYLVVRTVESGGEKEQWEQQFSESRAALIRELEREATARDIKLRSDLEVELVVLTVAEMDRGEAERVLSAVLDNEEIALSLVRLREEQELILPRRVRTLVLESDPPEAQAYLDHRPVGVTPCRVEDVPEGDHVLTFSKPGFLPHEEPYRIQPGGPGQKLRYRAALVPEPDMGVLEVRTFPPRARVTVRVTGDATAAETRQSPARWRLPAGPVEVSVELEGFEPQTLQVQLPGTAEDRPHVVQLRLTYSGPSKDEVVGRLVVYKPGAPPQASQRPPDATATRISSFFRDSDGCATGAEWDLPTAVEVAPEPPPILGERPLKRGVLLIGRAEAGTDLTPDIRLFDPENSVTRGCHAWLYVYADRSTGADYNTFLIGNNSPAGIRVDGNLVMETRRLSDDSEIEIGNFRMRVVKETPEARVEFGF